MTIYDQAYWDDRYRSAAGHTHEPAGADQASAEHESASDVTSAARTTVWSGNPNPVLVAEARILEPGRALDVGAGEGADSFWLASRGWRVTGVDLSPVALARAEELAVAADSGAASRITWLHRDVTDWIPDARAYDLVSSQFMHLPLPQRTRLFAGLAEAVAPGGLLLIVGHHPKDIDPVADRHGRLEQMFTEDEVASSLSLDEWEIVASEARPRDHVAPAGMIHDAVIAARRRV